MALIDQQEAAKLIRQNKDTHEDCQGAIFYNKGCEHSAQIVEQMKGAEEVEAIPVDWIQRYINACEMVSVMDGGAVTKWSADAVKAMLECWREEQTPTCGLDYCEIGGEHND